jgi:hypothetical protein
MIRSLSFVLLSFALVAGCGSSQKRAEAPEPSQTTPGSPPPASAPAQAQGAPSQDAPAADSLHMITDWQEQFDQTLADTDRLDCPNACRALGSLERSANNICGIVGTKASTCVDVQKKREDARSRVRERCGACP